MITRALLAAAAMIAALSGSAFAGPPKMLFEGAATIPNARQYLLRAESSGREYLVRVAEPAKPPPLGQKSPVIYVLDGNWYFGIATDIARMIPIGTSTPSAYVVAIGYTDPDFESVVTNREHDFMFGHFEDRPEIGGGGDAFLSFLVDELRPFIEQKYSVDRDRAFLAGQSLGGIFATNVLLKARDSFDGYLIGSPSIWADKTALPAARNLSSAAAAKRVMIGVGGLESPGMRENAAALATALSRQETGLEISSRLFENQHHMSMHGPWFAEGFRYMLDRPVSQVK